MAANISYRKDQLAQLTNQIGVYVLCDLDQVPIYVGQSSDGIRTRVGRHLTSARSDIIANRQIDVWEIAFVHAYVVANASELDALEARLYHHFDPHSKLMNGKVPPKLDELPIPEPDQTVQVMPDVEIESKRDERQRLPRQAAHYAQIVGHFLDVKNSKEISRAMDAHFERLKKYHQTLIDEADADD